MFVCVHISACGGTVYVEVLQVVGYLGEGEGWHLLRADWGCFLQGVGVGDLVEQPWDPVHLENASLSWNVGSRVAESSLSLRRATVSLELVWSL